MLMDKVRFSLQKKLHGILIAVCIALVPLCAFADTTEDAERRSDGARKDAPAAPPGPSPSDGKCSPCDIKERNLKRVSAELEEKKKAWAEIQRDIQNEGELRRELAVKEKGREFLKDDPNIGKEIDQLKVRLEGLPEKRAQLPSLEAKIKELEDRKAKLEREIRECRLRCEEEARKPRKVTGYDKDTQGPPQELDHPLGPPPRAPAAGCPEDCKVIAQMLGMLRADVEKKKEKMKSLEAARESARKEWEEKAAEVTKLQGLEAYVSREQTPEGIRSREEYNKEKTAACTEAVRLDDKVQAYNRALYKTETEIKGLNTRIKELEDCERKCQDPSKAHLKKVMEPPGSYAVTPAPAAACPECRRIQAELEEVGTEIKMVEEKARPVKEAMDLIDEDIEKLQDQLDDWETWSRYVSHEDRARTAYASKIMDLRDAIEEREKMWHRKKDELRQFEETIRKMKLEEASLRVKLGGCNKKCPVPGKTSCPAIPFEPLKIGPQLKYGSGAGSTAKDVAKNVLGGLIGGLFGGSSQGSSPGGMGESADRPPLDSNPFKQMGSFTDSGTGTAIRLAGRQTDTGMLLAAGVEEGSGKPTIHSITLHRDDDCSVMMPDQFFLYELYLNWHLSVTWTRTTYVDNQVVKRESGGWSSGGSELIGRGIFAAGQGGAGSIWQQFGFDKATGGPKTVGAEFKGLAKESAVKFPDKAVVHITRPDQDPVTTVPFIFSISKKPDGDLDFRRQLQISVTPQVVPVKD